MTKQKVLVVEDEFLIADMVAGVKTSVDIKPFRINRY